MSLFTHSRVFVHTFAWPSFTRVVTAAMVVFSVLLEVVKVGQMDATAGDIFLTFLQMAVFGPIFGVFCGYFFSTWIGQIFNSSEVSKLLRARGLRRVQ